MLTNDDPALFLLDLPRMRGLEIGPLARPRVRKSEGKVYYVDHCTTEELRRAYSANSLMRPHLDEIVEVDYVIKDGSTLSEAVGPDGPFDYLIASHVLEHLANPIGWLQDAEEVLTGDGLISLVIPDKRFCFDINRQETRPQDWVDWYLQDLKAPSYGQLFDFFAHVTTIDGMVDTLGLWAGTADYAGVRRADVPDADVAAYANCLRYRETGAYMDVHAGVYTPASLLSLLELAIRLGLLHFEVAHFVPTGRDSLEFHVTLRACAHRPSGQALGSIAVARQALTSAAVPEGAAPPVATNATPAPSQPGAEWLELSTRERELIALKRRVMQFARGIIRRWAS